VTTSATIFDWQWKSKNSCVVYQLLALGRWFSPGTPASSTTKTGRHDIAKILLKVALSTINQIKSNLVLDIHEIFAAGCCTHHDEKSTDNGYSLFLLISD
jgi:hypothetical protein